MRQTVAVAVEDARAVELGGNDRGENGRSPTNGAPGTNGESSEQSTRERIDAFKTTGVAHVKSAS